MPAQSRWEQAAPREGRGAAQGVTAFKQLLFASNNFSNNSPPSVSLCRNFPWVCQHLEHHRVGAGPHPSQVKGKTDSFFSSLRPFCVNCFKLGAGRGLGRARSFSSASAKHGQSRAGGRKKGGKNQCCLSFSLDILFLLCCPSASPQHRNYGPARGLISFQKTDLDEKEIMKSSRISPKFKRVQPQKTNNSNLYSLAPATLLPSTASSTSSLSGLLSQVWSAETRAHYF